jgi:protein TonB
VAEPRVAATKPEVVPPAPREEPAPSAPRNAAPAATLEPDPAEVAVLIPTPSREPAAAPEPEPAPPAPPEKTPLELLSRSEPAFPPKSLKRARGGGIVLKLLVNEKGRVSRVLVDQGTPYKDLEAAAVGAVLSWKYRPATEDGAAVKAWTTAEFDF